MSADVIYLDHNATTPVLPEVVDAMLPYLREHYGNPSSAHAIGRKARDAVEHARQQVARCIGADADEIVFTSGGTEANNLAIFGTADAVVDAGRRGIVTSVIEHPATARPCEKLAARGWRVARLGVDGDGRVTTAASGFGLVGDGVALVSVMHSNNETGVLQPIATLAQAAHRAGALMHCDAAQSVGKVTVDVRTLDVDLLSIAGHKLYAPKGVGALYVKRGTPLRPFVLGAGHERGLRPGTENVAGIVALGAACAAASRDLSTLAPRLRALTTQLWTKLREGVPGIALTGHVDARLPNTLHVRFPRVRGSAILQAAPRLAASTGSACHDGEHETPSSVITAMGIAPEEALGSVRLTLGRATTAGDVDAAGAALVEAWRGLAR